ncbi:glycosidase [Dysgonomonas sp. PH5-45]|uniref:alpha-amylase family glycosyl hydrolase n=1 Tax=unclassified Dysgonomonas TaxID=2630389 RepID=UPI0024763E3B|nr:MULTISPECIES: alpha-amylase family glycosyl hydrolase [unclassified Dysgonomonas]MDH6353771.1 glycosidase [Dysgonomonas sp. PH5-45]MDH6386674.1 glycosidase [Dysgonomonas sp. PH5-37]
MAKFLIYQVFPRWFGNTCSTNKENGTKDENGVGKFSSFSAKALSEIRKMGFSHIWYTGVIEHATKTDYSEYRIQKDNDSIVKGNAGSPYAIKDYYDVDPDLADNVENRMQEFEALVARTHKHDLKVIIDFVPNHVARQYCSDRKPRKVDDLGTKDDTTKTFLPDNNFYYIPNHDLRLDFLPADAQETYHESPAKATGNDRFDSTPTANDWYETVKLNYGVDHLNGHTKYFTPIPDTWYKMYDILMFWASKGVDGFRCDMAEMVPVEFWNWVIGKVKNKHKDIIFIAEVYNPSEYAGFIKSGRFDYLYDKVGLYDTLRGVVCGHRPASDLTACWQSLGESHLQMLNFLENHDEQRIASDFFAGDPRKAIPALIVSATMNTNPFMAYCGQELGERGMDKEGFSGMDGRTTIFDYWSVESVRNWYNGGKCNTEKLTDVQKSLRTIYCRVLSVCNTEPAISKGGFYDLMYVNYRNEHFDPSKQFAYLRASEGELLLVVVNFDDKDVRLKINIPAEAYAYFNIDPRSLKPDKELMWDGQEPVGEPLLSAYEVRLKAYSGKIIKFLSD